MHWDDPAQFPGAMKVDHPNGAARIAELRVVSEAPDELLPWVERAAAPVTVRGGGCVIESVSIEGADGNLVATIS